MFEMADLDSSTENQRIAESAVIDKFNCIIEDETHPLHRHIFLNKSGRVRLPKVKTNRFRGSFLIRAMTTTQRQVQEVIVNC